MREPLQCLRVECAICIPEACPIPESPSIIFPLSQLEISPWLEPAWGGFCPCFWGKQQESQCVSITYSKILCASLCLGGPVPGKTSCAGIVSNVRFSNGTPFHSHPVDGIPVNQKEQPLHKEGLDRVWSTRGQNEMQCRLSPSEKVSH